eukprot:295790-Pelagomonas_calceolata.AAC.2
MGSYKAAVLALGDDHEGVRILALQAAPLRLCPRCKRLSMTDMHAFLNTFFPDPVTSHLSCVPLAASHAPPVCADTRGFQGDHKSHAARYPG